MAEGVLLTGVYGSGKSSVAEEIAYLLEQQGERYALLDLDYLSWAGTGTGDRAGEFGLMLQNLAAVAANYRRAGIRLFVLAYFARSHGEVAAVRKVLGLPLRVARLTVPLPDIERRLAGDVTSGRRDDLAEAAASIAAAEGAGVEDMTISNDRPVADVARDVMTFLGWLPAAGLSSCRSSAPNRATLARLFVGSQPADIRICRIESVWARLRPITSGVLSVLAVGAFAAIVWFCTCGVARLTPSSRRDRTFARCWVINAAMANRAGTAEPRSCNPLGQPAQHWIVMRRAKHHHQLVFGRRTGRCPVAAAFVSVSAAAGGLISPDEQ